MPTHGAVEEIERSADPAAVWRVFERLGAEQPGADERLADDEDLRSALIVVAAASPWLGRVCVTDPAALDVLGSLHEPVPPPTDVSLVRFKNLNMLRIAARDLLNFDTFEEAVAELSELGDAVLQHVWAATSALAVIAMGKLGACELNYSSDLDVMLVSANGDGDSPASHDVRRTLEAARQAWRLDLDLRPEGRAGPLVRSLASYRAYWERWAQPWEFQALLKARAVAGDPVLGATFEDVGAEAVWGQSFGPDAIRQVRDLKGRAEESVARKGLSERELKRGPGGIRDIEFAVQLLQLVHGHADASLRDRSTLDGLRGLAAGGYVEAGDAEALQEAYCFLRTVEHRLQLYEDQQLHTVPSTPSALTRLARVLGYRDQGYEPAASLFDADLRRHRAAARGIHERLFFRPLLEAFAAGPGDTGVLGAEATAHRLAAFGFTDAERTRRAVSELTRGLTRSSRLMNQILPLLLDWLSRSPDPDLGLVGLRTLAAGTRGAGQLVALCRESPEGARQLCQLLGSGPRLARDMIRHPELLAGLANGDALRGADRADLQERLGGSLAWRGRNGAVEEGIRLFVRGERLRISARDVLGLAEPGQELSNLAESVLTAAVEVVAPPMPFAVIAMGRLGGRELGYRSDLDLMFVFESPEEFGGDAAEQAEAAALALLRLVGGATPAAGLYRVDTGLRPEGRDGPLVRSLAAYAAYYDRWAQAWERQALLRGRFVAGDVALGKRFAALAKRFVWRTPFGPADTREIRRLKARIERERIPPSEDPQFHLKLGPGSLSDIEWTAQLLQLHHGVQAEGTLTALESLVSCGALAADDAAVLVDSWRFCERTRNRLQLVRDASGDALPTSGPALTVLARSLATTPQGLREEYRRRTRRARRVVERLFYGYG